MMNVEAEWVNGNFKGIICDSGTVKSFELFV